MTKYTAIIFLGILVVILAVGGFPSWARTTLLVVSGVGISVLAYLSSVVYCSNCKKLISGIERENYEDSLVVPSRGANIVPSYIEDAEQALPSAPMDGKSSTPSTQ